MRNFASASFFGIFDRKVRPSDPFTAGPHWSVDGVDWTHDRHTFAGVLYRHSTDVFIGGCAGRKGWSVMVVTESWWVASKPNPIRTSRWAHLVSGDRPAALAWFKGLEPIHRVALNR